MAKKNKKIKILFILSIMLLIIMLLFGIIYMNKTRNNKRYQLDNQTYYEVILNPNNYFTKDKLEANNYYIASSIKYIDIYFNYYLKSQTKENINYSYDITATIKSYADNGTKLIWTKDFNLKNENNIKGKEVKIEENYKVDYQCYVDYVKSFQEYYNIKTETYLYINLNIKINEQENPYVLLTIPISENIIEITLKEDNTFLESDKQNINLEKIISFIFIVIATIYLASKFLFNKYNEDTILKEYKDIIISIQSMPNINIDSSVYLNSLKDLISIAINNNVNIFNYQNNYYIILNNIYYIYILKKRELKT